MIRFRLPDRSAVLDETLVSVHVAQLDAAWSKEPQLYIGPGGTMAVNRFRYCRIQRFLAAPDRPLDVPEIFVDDSGLPNFRDGRHRFPVLRDDAAPTLPPTTPARPIPPPPPSPHPLPP